MKSVDLLRLNLCTGTMVGKKGELQIVSPPVLLCRNIKKRGRVD